MGKAAPLLRPAGVLDDERGLELPTIGKLLFRTFGVGYLDWDSEALKAELTETFGSVGVQTWERVQAVRILHARESFWEDWHVFEKIAQAIVGEMTLFSVVQPPEAEEVAVAMVAADQIRVVQYSDEVLSYIASACLHDSTWFLEDPLDAAQGQMDEFDRKNGFSRDRMSVRRALEGRKGYYRNPSTAAEVQANEVLSVREAVKLYKKTLEQQEAELPGLIPRRK